MIQLLATAESLDQGRQLIDLGVDKVIIGEERYGLRLPGYLNLDEMAELIAYAKENDSQVVVAMNAILHNDKINTAREYLAELKEIGAEMLMVGDTGLIQILKEEAYSFPYIYDASVLVTSAGQVNFWAKYGAVSAKVAHEVPSVELAEMVEESELPLIYQVYGASCIHQSGRMLLGNYFNFVGKDAESHKDNDLFLSEPRDKDTHYSIFEDSHGTHVFANNDLDLMPYLTELNDMGLNNWYFDGIFTKGQAFADIIGLFKEARDHIQAGTWTEELAATTDEKVVALHPQNREVSTGFFLYARDKVQ